jgi:tRNA-(ms[2]io[6]A)-hydroxylase
MTLSEARHAELFVELAETYFPRDQIASRLSELAIAEARIVDGLAIRATLH